MHLTIDGIVSASALEGLSSDLESMTFADGRATAGWAARLVKQNAQAEPDLLASSWRDRIAEALVAHEVFRLAAQPKRIIGPMFTRYASGDQYGIHVDDAVLDGSRADLAFTLFLSDSSTYDGGELVIDSPTGVETHKLPRGTLFLYPATALHRVAPVTSGVRIAAVGWVRSYIRSPEQRELLFDLETVRRRVFETGGKTEEFDLLSKCAANLMRMWCGD